MDFKPSTKIEEGGYKHPLIRFTGRLISYDARTEKQEGRDERAIVDFNFDNVKVIESREPYPLTAAKIPITYGLKPSSNWAAWVKSVKSLIPTFEEVDELLKKEQEWYFSPVLMQRPTDEKDSKGKNIWKEVPVDVWQVIAIEGLGASPANPMRDLLDIIATDGDGKSQNDIESWLFSNKEIKAHRGYPDILQLISAKSLFTTLESAGLMKNNSGVMEKV